MNLEMYLTMLRREYGIGTRVIRIKDMNNREEHTCYNVILIPQDMDGEDGVSYRIESDIEGLSDDIRYNPSSYAVLGAWPLDELVRGAMYIEDTAAVYFESEV